MAGEGSDRRESFFSRKRERELLPALDPAKVPSHVAVIMDGNGRWAAKRGLPRIAGHRASAKAIREVIETCIECGVRVLTLYSFSSENWNRPADEVSGLMSLFVEILTAELASLESKGVRLRLIGRRSELPGAVEEAFRRAEERTAGNEVLTLVVAINYGGRAEIVDAVRAIAAEVAGGTLEADAVGEADIAERLYTTGIHDPDLVIRTSGEMRVSNFLLWQIAYSELWVTSVLWPDFGRYDLLRALVDYEKRARRYGGI